MADEKRPLTTEQLQLMYGRKRWRDALDRNGCNVRDVTEGPIVDQLVYVFEQLKECGLAK